MLTVNALTMINIRPRDRQGDCVPIALTFITGAAYTDIEDIILDEQSGYKPHNRSKGVYTTDFLKESRVLFGTKFTKLNEKELSLGAFIQKYNKGTYLVCKHRHAFVVKDGQRFDACDSALNVPIIRAWHAEKI